RPGASEKGRGGMRLARPNVARRGDVRHRSDRQSAAIGEVLDVDDIGHVRPVHFANVCRAGTVPWLVSLARAEGNPADGSLATGAAWDHVHPTHKGRSPDRTRPVFAIVVAVVVGDPAPAR